jgi:hypothetical protein
MTQGRDIIDAAQRMADAYARLNAKLREGETVRDAFAAGRITAADLEEFRAAYAAIKALGWSDPFIDGFASDLLN